ncbi:unnamed protein product [Heterobilharzia americana]|nr:unnamed protein product [Heterobilharzia americana]
MISSLFEKLAGQIRAARTTLWSVYQLRNCEIDDISNQLISRMVTFVLQNLLKTETNNRNRLIQFNKLSDPTSSILSKNTIDCIQNTYRQQNTGKWFMYKPFSSSSCNQPVIWSGTPIPFSQQPTLQSNSQNRDEDTSSQGCVHGLTTNHQMGSLYTHSTLIFPHTTPLSVQPALLMTSSFLPSSSSHHYYHPPIESCNHGLLSNAFYGNSK